MNWTLDKATGYVYGMDTSSPYADTRGRVYQHHYVMCNSIGRRLEPGECVHHKDRDKTNNKLDNLQLMTIRSHGLLHAIEDRGFKAEIRYCRLCGKEMCVSVRSKQKYCSELCSRKDSRLFEIDSDDLSALVWAMPSTEVAKLLGVSDVAVAKRCRKLGVTKPPRGYWTKVRQNPSK